MRSTAGLASRLYTAAEDPPGREWRRSSARREVRSRVRIRPHGKDREQFGYTLNVTPSALCVNCKGEFEPFTMVDVCLDEACGSSDEGWAPAVVVHRTQTINGYKVGLRLH
jgi:hypothetical protein